MKLEIDGEVVKIEEGATLLDAARSVGIEIPTLCYHPALEPFGVCRLCSVEIEWRGGRGRKKIVTACNYPAEEGLVVKTKSPEVVEVRKMLLELLLARCPGEGRIQSLAREYGVRVGEGKPRFRLELAAKEGKEEVAEQHCILCGLCTRVCEELVGVSAINVLGRGVEREVGTPYKEPSDDCVGCGSCALVCPTEAIKLAKNIFPTTAEDEREIENRFLDLGAGSKRDEALGVYSDLVAAKSSVVQGQDGGMVSALLVAGLENGFFDSAVVVQRGEGYKAEAVVVEDAAGVRSASGTKYLRVPMVSKIAAALKEGALEEEEKGGKSKSKRRIAVVGTPCEVRAVRKLEREFPGAEITVLGLFCLESFDYEGLKEETRRRFGVDLDRAEKTQITKGKFIVTAADGEVFSCDVRELEGVVREGCPYCDDFVSRLADISVGSVGSPDGFSTVVVRSRVGKRLLDATEFVRGGEFGVDKSEIVKLAKLKKRNADRKFAEILEGLEV